MNSMQKRVAVQATGQLPTSIMTPEEVEDFNVRVTAALDFRRRVNLATGLTAVPVESDDKDVVIFKLQAIAGFTIATVHCTWVPEGPSKGWWRIGRLLSFDMADLRAAIDQ